MTLIAICALGCRNEERVRPDPIDARPSVVDTAARIVGCADGGVGERFPNFSRIALRGVLRVRAVDVGWKPYEVFVIEVANPPCVVDEHERWDVLATEVQLAILPPKTADTAWYSLAGKRVAVTGQVKAWLVGDDTFTTSVVLASGAESLHAIE